MAQKWLKNGLKVAEKWLKSGSKVAKNLLKSGQKVAKKKSKSTLGCGLNNKKILDIFNFKAEF